MNTLFGEDRKEFLGMFNLLAMFHVAAWGALMWGFTKGFGFDMGFIVTTGIIVAVWSVLSTKLYFVFMTKKSTPVVQPQVIEKVVEKQVIMTEDEIAEKAKSMLYKAI